MNSLTTEQARSWIARWDAQQQGYSPQREQRFQVIIDAIDAVITKSNPLIVDLGVGPASLATRILRQFPEVTVVGVDADPLLLGMATAAYPELLANGRLRLVAADLRRPDWYESLGLGEQPDVFASTMALHWLNRAPLRALMQTCAQHLARPGLFVNGDHLYEGTRSPQMESLNRTLAQRLAERADTPEQADWDQWWLAVETAPELADLTQARQGGFDHTVTERPTVFDYLDDLLASGFTESGTIWQFGDDRVVVGLA